jgi:putative transposase
MSDVVAAADQISLEGNFQISDVCECLAIPRSTFYEHRKEDLTLSETNTRELTPMIMDVFWKHRKRYGTRRIVEELADNGFAIGRKRVADIMKSQGLRAIQPKSFTPKTTESRHRLGYSPNLLLEEFSLSKINQLWVGDITYIPLAERRFGYLAMLMDRFSRRLIGWHIDRTMTEDLVIHGLRNAIAIRQPGKQLIHHTDRGGQYAGKQFRAILRRASIRQSMSRAADCYDNAFMESCFGTIKIELEMTEYKNMQDAEMVLAEYFTYYNCDRKHSGIGYQTPIQFESNQLVHSKP